MTLHSIKFLSVVLILSGCGALQNTPPVISGCLTYDEQIKMNTPKAVSVLSPEIAKIVGVKDIKTSATSLGFPAIQTTIYNCTDVDIAILARTKFESSFGKPEATSAWKTILLAPRSEALYYDNSVSEKTTGMLIEIYDGNRGQTQFHQNQTYTAPINSIRGN